MEYTVRREMDKILGSVTLVLLPLKYEIDDSVSVTVRGSVTGGGGQAGCCTLMGGTYR